MPQAGLLDRRDRNPFAGAAFLIAALANPRVTRLSLPLLTSAEVKGHRRAMLRALGAAGDALRIPDTGLSRAKINVRAICGAAAEPGAEVMTLQESLVSFSRSFTIIERV